MDDPVDLSIAEFINHPSFRQVASFFLGFVFISCIQFSYHVPIAAARRIRSRFLSGIRRHGGQGLEANRGYGDEKVHSWLGTHRVDHASSISSVSESNNLALSLTICFAMGSIAQFGSLLVFSDKQREAGRAGCAFLVAWGGMAAQAGRLLGLLKLSLDLRKMGVRKWETFIFWGWLVFALVIMFVSNAISIGSIVPIPQTASSALCLRKRYLPIAVVSSAVDVILEFYCLTRIYYLLVPAFLSAGHKFDAILDVRISRSFSLLLLDLAAAAPALRSFGVLVDVLPTSIASLLVLAAFNQRSPDVSVATTVSIPPTRPDSVHSRSTIEIKKMPSAQSLAARRAARISHPFAASALQDPAPETEDWPESASPPVPEKPFRYPAPARSGGDRKSWRASVQSAISESDSDIARSVKGAVVSFAFKDRVASNRSKTRERDRRSFLPSMPTSSSSDSKSSQHEPSTPSRSSVVPTVAPSIPKPVIPALDMEGSSSERPPVARPDISVTKATPVTLTIKPPLPSISPPNSKHPSVSITLPTSYSSSSKSLHLTPTTPAHSHPSHSHHVSADSNLTGEWRYDSRHDSFNSSHGGRSGSDDSANASRRQSGMLPPADDDLSIVYEASHEDSEGIPPSRAYRPTFGEHMFIQGGLGGQVFPPPDVPQDVHPEEASRASTKSGSSGNDRI